MNTLLALAACCAAIGLAGCTNLPKAQDYSTSLGESQSQLRQDPDWNAGRVWVRPGPSIGSLYDKKLILEKKWSTSRATVPTTWTCATTRPCASARWTI